MDSVGRSGHRSLAAPVGAAASAQPTQQGAAAIPDAPPFPDFTKPDPLHRSGPLAWLTKEDHDVLLTFGRLRQSSWRIRAEIANLGRSGRPKGPIEAFQLGAAESVEQELQKLILKAGSVGGVAVMYANLDPVARFELESTFLACCASYFAVETAADKQTIYQKYLRPNLQVPVETFGEAEVQLANGDSTLMDQKLNRLRAAHSERYLSQALKDIERLKEIERPS
jgi:hypothetical protein